MTAISAPGHRRVATARVAIGHDAVADLKARLGPLRDRAGRAEVDVVGMSRDHQDTGNVLFVSHPPILRLSGIEARRRPGAAQCYLKAYRVPGQRTGTQLGWSVTTFSADRSYAQDLDAADQLAPFRDRFVRHDRELIYLDGNSLGPLPVRTQARIAEVVDQDWGVGLVRSWDKWIQLPRQAGDMLGEHLVGAAPGQVLVCDSVTVNLYKLAWAALDATAGPRRHRHRRRQLPHRPLRARGHRRAARLRAAADPLRHRRRHQRAGAGRGAGRARRARQPLARGLPQRRAGRHGAR